MPTPIPGSEKTAALAIIAVFDPQEAADLATILVNYEDIVNMIARQLPVFEYYNNYLTQLMAVFTDANLQSVNIWNAKIGPINNDPDLIINSSVTGTTLITVNNKHVGILGNSTVEKIKVNTTKTLDDLWIGPGAKLSLLDVTTNASYCNNIWIRNQRNAPGILTSVALGSNINTNGVFVEPGAYYGGFIPSGTATPCAYPVTAVSAATLTHNTLKLTWGMPAGAYLKIDVYFKKSGSGVWIIANDEMGDFLPNDTGYVFRVLDKDAYYDFKVTVTCVNGNVVDAFLTDTSTTCC